MDAPTTWQENDGMTVEQLYVPGFFAAGPKGSLSGLL